MDQSNLVSCNPDVLTSKLGDSLMCMNLDTGNYHELDRIGSNIWQRLSEPVEVKQLCSALAADFKIDQDQCRSDVLPFLDEMSELNLIVVNAPVDATG